MPHFFRKEETTPFQYPVIQTHKRRDNHSGWIIGGILLIFLFVVGWLLF